MTLIRTLLASVAAFGAIAACGPAAQAAELKFAHVYETSSIYHKWAEWAADEIASRTDGRHSVDVFPASSLGSENDLFESLSIGAVDMTYSGSFYASGIHGPMAISSGPYMFRDYEHWKAYRDSPLFEEISAGFEEASGHKVLGLTYYGARHLTANEELPTPESMENLKLRVPNAPMYLLFPESVGANATPIAFAEVYLALQQGVVDAQENPLPTILAKKFYEVQSHIMLTGHILDSIVTIAAGPTWEALSDEDKAIFEEVYGEAAVKATEAVRASEAELAEAFASEYGKTVVEVDRAPFREAMQPLLQRDDMPWTAELVERGERDPLTPDPEPPRTRTGSIMAVYPKAETDRRIAAADLLDLAARIFAACGMGEADARLLAETLVHSDRRGVHSHGVLRIPDYVGKLTREGVDPRGVPRVVSEAGGAIRIDGGNTMGQIGGTFAMDRAISVAKDGARVAFAALGNSNHCGAMDWYTLRASRAGMIGLAGTNALPTMAPVGGTEKIVGINPLSVAMPGEARPFVLDFAFGATAHGKIRVYDQKGAPIPEGWALDADGHPTTDAARAMKGLIQPIGGHKGVALGMMVGMLSTFLSGAGYGLESGNMVDGPDGRPRRAVLRRHRRPRPSWTWASSAPGSRPRSTRCTGRPGARASRNSTCPARSRPAWRPNTIATASRSVPRRSTTSRRRPRRSRSTRACSSNKDVRA